MLRAATGVSAHPTKTQGLRPIQRELSYRTLKYQSPYFGQQEYALREV